MNLYISNNDNFNFIPFYDKIPILEIHFENADKLSFL